MSRDSSLRPERSTHMSVKRACVGLKRGADLPPLTCPAQLLRPRCPPGLYGIGGSVLADFIWELPLPTFYFQVKISTLAFSPKKRVVY